MATKSLLQKYTLLLALSYAPFAHAVNVPDPLEGLNRDIFTLNKIIDATYMKPASVAYQKIIPMPARASITNFIENIAEVPVAVNDILQGRACDALSATARLLINSSLGIFGLFDVATPLGITRHRSDMGKTLYVWGWKESSYFVIPLLGPSTIRDAIGLTANLFIYPSTYFRPKWRNYYYGLALIDKRTQSSEFEGLVGVAGVEYYNLIRSTYTQNRYFFLTDGQHSMQNPAADTLTGQPPD